LYSTLTAATIAAAKGEENKKKLKVKEE